MKISNVFKAIALLVFCQDIVFAQTLLLYDKEQETVEFGVKKLQQAFSDKSEVLQIAYSSNDTKLPAIQVISNKNIPKSLSDFVVKADFENLEKEGFEFRWINDGKTLLIISIDEVGAEYGLMELAEFVIATGNYKSVPQKVSNPELEYRIVKFNMPWSPYRTSAATETHMKTCRDLKFWERFLDMMVENRLNTLSLWNNHPFPYMIKSTNFPKATSFNDQEMAEWQSFGSSYFAWQSNVESKLSSSTGTSSCRRNLPKLMEQKNTTISRNW